jgi:hypothetical protein
MKLDPLTSQYIDSTYILSLVKTQTNDQSLGELVRAYVSKCSERAIKDEPFSPYATLRTMGSCPSELRTHLLNQKESNE